MRRASLLLLSAAAILAGCSTTPAYKAPAISTPASFKEAPGWQPAHPADAVARGAWWQLFNDPTLSALEQRVLVSNQTLAADAAAYAQARALVRENRAALFPELDLSGRATRAGSFGHGQTVVIDQGTGTSGSTGTGSTGSTGSTVTTSSGSSRYSLTLGATWEPDVWGRVGATVSQARANAEASRGDLSSATLSIQGELATDYLTLRALDAQAALLAGTIQAYDKALTITNNRYQAGVVAKVDVLQAQSQLASARAAAADLGRQRAIYEHAIAVLVGESPSSFLLPVVPNWSAATPDVPGVLPSVLLQRRPDVAAAERRVAAANSGIGIERSAYFPTFDLSADSGTSASKIGDLVKLSSTIWSLGLNTALTLLDFGARHARVQEARAAYDQAVANYRQTALTAFQQTEDSLAASRILADVSAQREIASETATRTEQMVLNQYLAGQVSFTDVITAQATALAARQTAIEAALDRQAAAVSLIQAIGGTWTGAAQSSVGIFTE